MPGESQHQVYLARYNDLALNTDSNSSVTVITSGDKGQTWETANITVGGSVSWMIISFMTREQGWLITCGEPSMGTEKHSIYTTSDDGKTWTTLNNDIDKVYGRMLSGAGFINEKIVFCASGTKRIFSPRSA